MSGLLTASRLKSYRACPRQHHLRYELGYVPTGQAGALAFGTMIHAGLEAWWATPGHPLEAALALVPEGIDPFERARAQALLVGYDLAWGEWAAGCEILGVEVPFTLPLVNPATGAASRTWTLAGKLDALVRLPDGRTAVVEHKTSSDRAEPGGVYRAKLTMDGQVSQYIEGAEALGFPADLVVYDVLVKPSTRPLAATPPEARKYTKAGALYASQRDSDETPSEYLERLAGAVGPDSFVHVEVVRFEAEREEYRHDVWQLGRMIREGELSGFAPRNPDACHTHGSPCPYWPVCTGTASLDDPGLYRRVENVNPELAPAAPAEAA